MFLSGGGGGGGGGRGRALSILGLPDNFFLKNNAFQTILLITFSNKIYFFTTILKTLQAF